MDIFRDSFKLVTKPRLAPPPSRIGMISIGLICLLGFGAGTLSGYSASETYRQNHMQRTSSIAEALPLDEVNELKPKPEEAEKEQYKRLKERLERIRQTNTEISFVYIMVEDKNRILFLADSEPQDSPDYSPPGQQYYEASLLMYSSFEKQQAFFEGPYKDRWGTWMSSSAPIYNPENGKFIGMLGIDSPPNQYYNDILSRAILPILVAIIASLLLWKIDNVRRKHEEITQLKSQFVSIASHELRSPLSGMMWAIQTLLKDKDTPKNQLLILEDMFKSTESSLTTVNEILDMSVFERHKVSKHHKVDMDVNAALSEVIKNLRLAASEKNIILQTRHLDVAAPLLGDPGAMKRALMNVVTNALKYSPNDSKVLVAYQRVHDKHIIKVTDRGIGIPEKDIKKVLNGYFRAKNAVKMQTTGTGLGLHVTNLIIKDHHGTITIQSKEKRGTTIEVRLPANIKA